jgi:Cys-tRNA synthase (O-phospho-L-seryl-tRNA:Cys-tRNA synthase)
MPKKKKETIETPIEKIEKTEITASELQVVSSIKLDFQGLKLEANEKYNFSTEAFDEIKKKHPNIEVFIERGVVKID